MHLLWLPEMATVLAIFHLPEGLSMDKPVSWVHILMSLYVFLSDDITIAFPALWLKLVSHSFDLILVMQFMEDGKKNESLHNCGCTVPIFPSLS